MPSQKFSGGWTGQKLRILDDYLTAYCRIFQVNPLAKYFETIYVDAFAGTGLIEQRKTSAEPIKFFAEFIERETIEFLAGSASRALQHPFTRYVFIEKAASRVRFLGVVRIPVSETIRSELPSLVHFGVALPPRFVVPSMLLPAQGRNETAPEPL